MRSFGAVLLATLVVTASSSAIAQAPALGTPASQANGVRASFLASRTVPIREVIVTFNHIEHIKAGEGSLSNRGKVLVEALKAEGLTIAHWTSALNPGASVGPNAANRIGDPGASASVDASVLYTLTISGFRRVEDVVLALAKQGVRQTGSLKLRPADTLKLADEMGIEAVKEATAKARKMAEAVGASGLEVIDASVTPLTTHTSAETHSVKDGDGLTVNLTATVLLGQPRSAR